MRETVIPIVFDALGIVPKGDWRKWKSDEELRSSEPQY